MKEARRHLANRGGIVLALLLVVAAVLLSVFNPTTAEAGTAGGDLVGGVHHCYVDYPRETPFVKALRARVPPALKAHIYFRERKPETISQLISDQPGTGVIRVLESAPGGVAKIEFEVWHPPGDPSAMADYERWLWRTTREILHERAIARIRTAGGDTTKIELPHFSDDDLWAIRESFRHLRDDTARLEGTAQNGNPLPTVEIRRDGLGMPPLDFRSAIATAMVVFAIYFTCCYLLPTLNCEERERGVLLAQALSPASPVEIVMAKFLFYPVAGVILAAVLAGVYSPGVLNTLFFWLALFALASGFLGIGMTVSTLAKTQRSAFMGSMCYLMSVSLILFICSQNAIPYVSLFAIEFHGPKIIHAAMTRNVEAFHWLHLAAALGLGWSWMGLAAWLFRRRGWQ
jgi:hypothetical protein